MFMEGSQVEEYNFMKKDLRSDIGTKKEKQPI
jgi:hypothetical protein